MQLINYFDRNILCACVCIITCVGLICICSLDNDDLFTPFKRYLNALIGQVCDSNHFEKLRGGKGQCLYILRALHYVLTCFGL